MLPKIYDEISNITSDFEEKTKEVIVQDELKLKDVYFDFENERFFYDGIEPKKLYDKKEIIKQWILKLFKTEKDRWNIYIFSNKYPFGLNLHKYLGQQLYPNLEYIELIKSDIYNSLLNNKEIKEIHCLQLFQIDDVMYCGFIVELSNEEAFEMEVIQ